MTTVILLRDAASLALVLVVAATLLLALTFAPRPIRQSRILKPLCHHRVLFLAFDLIVVSLGASSRIAASHLADRLSFEDDRGPGPDTIGTPVATTTAIALELERTTATAIQKRAALAHFSAAEPFLRERDYTRAIPEYRASLATLPTQSAYLNLGIALRYTDEFNAAIAALTSGLARARRAGTCRFEANFIYQLGGVDYARGQRKEAEPYLSRARALFQKCSDKTAEADALLSLASLYRLTGRQDQARALPAQAEALYRQSSNVLGLANVALYQGVNLVGKGNCQEAFTRFTLIDHLAGQARARIAIGSCLALRKPAEAERELRAARRLAVSSDQMEIQGAAIIALAQLLSRERRFTEAHEVADEALRFGDQIKAPAVQQYAHIVLADCDLNLKHPSDALAHANEAVRLAQRTRDVPGSINALCLKGKLLSNSDPAQALAALRQAVDAAKADQLPPSVDCLRDLGNALAATGNDRESEEVRIEIKRRERDHLPP